MMSFVPPNGARLSCAAKFQCSQMEFFTTRAGGASSSRWLGRRPLLDLEQVSPDERHDTYGDERHDIVPAPGHVKGDVLILDIASDDPRRCGAQANDPANPQDPYPVGAGCPAQRPDPEHERDRQDDEPPIVNDERHDFSLV